MTLFDLLFILIFLATVAAIVTAIFQAVRGHTRNSLRVLGASAVSLAVYFCNLLCNNSVHTTPRPQSA